MRPPTSRIRSTAPLKRRSSPSSCAPGDRERKLIRKIDQTIEKLDQQDYGYCETCGMEIGLRRLEARPTATQCVDCKSLAEIKERQLRG